MGLDGEKDPAFERWRELFTKLVRMQPKLVHDMFESSEAVLGRGNVARQYGADLSSIHVPATGQKAIQIFAAKLTKVLHYIHTGKRLLHGSSIRFTWFSNQSFFTGEGRVIPEEVEKLLGMSGEIKRERRNLKDQFDYLFSVSAGGEAGVYYCFFRKSFAFISFASVDERVIESAVDRLRARTPGEKDKLVRIDWPLIAAKRVW
jgi:hypothetical protein